MDRCVHIDDLRGHLETAKDKLSHEKAEILKLHPLPDDFNREEYAFHYVRAERFGLKAINRRLAEIAWLPMQLDPHTEMLSESRNSMKRWLTASLSIKPDSAHFGNDFIHALTRCALEHGNEHPATMRLSGRIANLFRDLSCLIGLIYYCTWLSENHIEGVELTNPQDLNRTAEEIAALIQSPEIYQHIRAREQDDEKKNAEARAAKKERAAGGKKSRPALRVIENTSFVDTMAPDPVLV